MSHAPARRGPRDTNFRRRLISWRQTAPIRRRTVPQRTRPTAVRDAGQDKAGIPPGGVVQAIPCATSTRRWPSPESLAEAKHRLDEDDKRQETDHGYAHGGDGFEDGTI